MKVAIIKAAGFLCAAAGVLVWLSGSHKAGIGMVIGGYIVYVLVRIISRLRKTSPPAPAAKKEAEPESKPNPDSWESMRLKASEALDRKLRGHALDIDSFFRPAAERYPALAIIKKHLLEDSDEKILRADLDSLKLHLDSAQTAEALGATSVEAETADGQAG